MSFLTAEWRKLVLINYQVDPVVLQSYVPKGTQLDFWNDRCYVSLVGFMFVNTKLRGVKVPFHINFEEVNLRFYVKRVLDNETRRGVVFVKEIVPRRALSAVANMLYKENYQTVPMRHSWDSINGNLRIKYAWRYKRQWQSFIVETENKHIPIEKGSKTEFITEHYWGYTKVRDNKTYEYEVTHPTWEHYPVKNYLINMDFGLNYGGEFAFLNSREPESVILAEGSSITVERKHRVRN